MVDSRSQYVPGTLVQRLLISIHILGLTISVVMDAEADTDPFRSVSAMAQQRLDRLIPLPSPRQAQRS